MNKNNTVDTAKKGQTTTKNTSKVPTGKVTTLKEAEARKKAREEQYKNFRVNALKRRCKRMKISEEDTKKYVEKLLEQLKAPNEYSILVMIYKNSYKGPKKAKEAKEQEIFVSDFDKFKEDLAKANIKYNYCGDNFVSITGDQNILAKIREIAPLSAKIQPYAKKMESVLADVKPPENTKKSTNNTADKKAAAKKKRKMSNIAANKKRRHSRGQFARKEVRNLRQELKKKRKAKIVQIAAKKASEGSKTLKKAA